MGRKQFGALVFLATAGIGIATYEPPLNDLNQPTYGVDVSFPIHRAKISDNYAWLPHNLDPENNPTTPERYEGMPVQTMGNKQKFYNEFIQGCRDYYGRRGMICDETEADRLEMGLRQPKSMQNYTDLGFKKIRAPEKVFRLIEKFWEKNKDKEEKEEWSAGNTYTNHWLSNTGFVSVEDEGLRGGGSILKARIWEAAKETLEQWTGQELSPCSLYGIRVYKDGAVLSTHVDRLPLVSSAIINVAQDIDEPWPIEVYAHDGKAYNITMEPGDMVLYESHSVLHGRPFPLKGRFYANVFIHFEPIGHSLQHGVAPEDDVKKQYRRAAKNGNGGHEGEDTSLPPYIVRGSAEEENWKLHNPRGWEIADAADFSTGSSPAHQAAGRGDVEALRDIAMVDKDKLHAKDSNGWQPIHEGARGGHIEVVQLLLEHGADANERSNHGLGATPLRLAREAHGDNHPLVEYLESIGAVDVGPDL